MIVSTSVLVLIGLIGVMGNADRDDVRLPRILRMNISGGSRYAAMEDTLFFTLDPADGPCDGPAKVGEPALEVLRDDEYYRSSFAERCVHFDPPLSRKLESRHELSVGGSSASAALETLVANVVSMPGRSDLSVLARNATRQVLPIGSSEIQKHAAATGLSEERVQLEAAKSIEGGIRAAIRQRAHRIAIRPSWMADSNNTSEELPIEPALIGRWVSIAGSLEAMVAVLPAGSVLDTRAQNGAGYHVESLQRELGLLTAGDFVVEVGSGVGLRTAAYSIGVGSSGRVISLEANPVLARMARVNMDNFALGRNNTLVLNAAAQDASSAAAGSHWQSMHNFYKYSSVSSPTVRGEKESKEIRRGFSAPEYYSTEMIISKSTTINLELPPRGRAAVPTLTVDDIVFGPEGDGQRPEWGWSVQDWEEENLLKNKPPTPQSNQTSVTPEERQNEEELVGFIPNYWKDAPEKLIPIVPAPNDPFLPSSCSFWMQLLRLFVGFFFSLQPAPKTFGNHVPQTSFNPLSNLDYFFNTPITAGTFPTPSNKIDIDPNTFPPGLTPPRSPYHQKHHALWRALNRSNALFQTISSPDHPSTRLSSRLISRHQHTSLPALRRFWHARHSYVRSLQASVPPGSVGGGKFAAWASNRHCGSLSGAFCNLFGASSSAIHSAPNRRLLERPPQLRKCPSLLRVAAAGSEGRVLAGATETLAACAPIVSVDGSMGAGSVAALSILDEAGYDCYWVVDVAGRFDDKFRDDQRGTLKSRAKGDPKLAAQSKMNWDVDLLCYPRDPARSRAFYISRRWWEPRPTSMAHQGLTRADPDNLPHKWKGYRHQEGDETLGAYGRKEVEQASSLSFWLPPAIRMWLKQRAIASQRGTRPWSTNDAWFTSYSHIVDSFDGIPRLFTDIGNPNPSPSTGQPLRDKISRELADFWTPEEAERIQDPSKLFDELFAIKEKASREEMVRAQNVLNRQKK